MLTDLLWAVALFVAIGLALGASKLRISPWWIFLPGAVAIALMALLYSAETSCDAPEAVGWTFLAAVLVAILSFVLTTLTALIDTIRHGGRRRLLPVVPTLVLAIVAFFLVGSAFGSCMR